MELSCVEGVTGRLITKMSVNARKSGRTDELPILVDEMRGSGERAETGCVDRCDPCKEKPWNERERWHRSLSRWGRALKPE